MANRRHETPRRRVNPSGGVVWVARYTARNGRRYSAGTFPLKREAQDAIDAAYASEYTGSAVPRGRRTVAQYAETWTRLHPRSERTNQAYDSRLRAVLEVRVGGRPFGRWQMRDVERAEIAELVDVMLCEQKRSASGARAVIRVLCAMWEDAVTDRVAQHNAVRGLRIRSADPRVTKRPREPRVWSWEQMHGFADGAGTPHGRAMLLTLALCGLRIGEMLPLERSDIEDGRLTVQRTAHEGRVEAGTKTTRGAARLGRSVPIPAELAAALRELPPRLDTRLLFGNGKGRVMRHDHFYELVWNRARAATPDMVEARPHDFRHSYVSLLRAEGVDPALVAKWSGHSVLTATLHYTHAVNEEAAARDMIAKRRLSS